MRKRKYWGGVLVFICYASQAAGLDELKTFWQKTHSASADFTQQVIRKNGQAGQKATGIMQFQRPGKFRWEYTQPYNQLIIASPEKLWTYDKQLKQVVIKPMLQALGSTPAALLAGDSNLEKNFELKNTQNTPDLEWIEALPKSREAGFERILIGFKNAIPVAMEVHDNFGQKTQLRFEHFSLNPALPAQNFKFTPPVGVDVIGE